MLLENGREAIRSRAAIRDAPTLTATSCFLRSRAKMHKTRKVRFRLPDGELMSSFRHNARAHVTAAALIHTLFLPPATAVIIVMPGLCVWPVFRECGLLAIDSECDSRFQQPGQQHQDMG